MNANSEQISGREGKTATALRRRFLILNLRGSGFASHHLNRYNNDLRQVNKTKKRQPTALTLHK